MELENEMFLVEEASFESILYWMGKEDRSSEICDMVKMYRSEIDRDIDSFYQVQYVFCQRAISLLSIYECDEAFEDVFYIYEVLSLEEDEVLTGVCEHYLKDISSSKHHRFLLENWKRLYFEWGDEDITILAFCFLLSSGYRDKDVDQFFTKVIWSDNHFAKCMVTHDLENIPVINEVKRRLRFVSPMVKYGPQDRFGNRYCEEWIDLSDTYLKNCKGVDTSRHCKTNTIERSPEDEFLLNILGGFDKRAKKVNEKYLDEYDSDDYMKCSMKGVEERERLMEEEFLDVLPGEMDDWFSSPFIEEKQRLEMSDFVHDFMISLDSKKQIMKKKIGRNDLCPCSSGKKYKKCCINGQVVSNAVSKSVP